MDEEGMDMDSDHDHNLEESCSSGSKWLPSMADVL